MIVSTQPVYRINAEICALKIFLNFENVGLNDYHQSENLDFI
jgi:hypothetical protein